MKVRVTDSDGLHALYATYLQLVEEGRERELIVELAGGSYGLASIGPIHLDLDGPAMLRDPKIEITVRGPAHGEPAIFQDVGVRVTARRFRLENVILRGRQQSLLKVQATRGVELRGVGVVGNGIGGPWGGKLIEINAMASTKPCSVELRECWFMDNQQENPAAMLTIAAGNGAYIDEVSLRDTAFINNHFTAEIALFGVQEVEARGCLFLRRAMEQGAGPPPALFQYAPTQRFRIRRSTVITDQLADVAAGQPIGGVPGPVELIDTALCSLSGERSLPASLSAKAPDFIAQAPIAAALETRAWSTIAGELPTPGAVARLRPLLGLEHTAH